MLPRRVRIAIVLGAAVLLATGGCGARSNHDTAPTAKPSVRATSTNLTVVEHRLSIEQAKFIKNATDPINVAIRDAGWLPQVWLDSPTSVPPQILIYIQCPGGNIDTCSRETPVSVDRPEVVRDLTAKPTTSFSFGRLMTISVPGVYGCAVQGQLTAAALQGIGAYVKPKLAGMPARATFDATVVGVKFKCEHS